MAGPCTLDSVQLLCGSDVYNHGIFLNARVYACHTTVTELDSVYEDNYAGKTPKAAMSRDTLYLRWQNGVWHGLGFDSPFDYDGTDNLILEFRWQGDNDSSVYDLGWYTPGNRAMDAKSSTAERGTPRNYMPRFRIFYSPTGIAQGPVPPPASALPVSATPNPFTSSVTLQPAGVAQQPLTAAVYSSTGRLVRRIVGTGSSPALRWDGRDEAGRRVEAGTYFCRVRSGSRVQTVHLILRN
jgi:hypothetical protein